MITLTKEEREKFAAYLEQEAAFDDAMANQLTTMGPNMAPMVKKMKMDVACQMIVAGRLRNIEDMSIG